MKNASFYAARFATLLKRIKAKYPGESPDPADPISQVIIAFLEWNTTRSNADKAFRRLMSQCVDINELRVCHPHEIVRMIGSRYPRAEERSIRLLETLNAVFQREQAVALRSLEKKGKKEVRAYLDSLPGIPPFVVAQVTLFCYEGHAIPVDDQLAALLRSEQVVNEEATIEEIGSFLEHQIRAGTGLDAYTALMAWIDAGPKRLSLDTPKRRSTKSAQTQSSTKKASKTKVKKVTKSHRTAVRR